MVRYVGALMVAVGVSCSIAAAGACAAEAPAEDNTLRAVRQSVSEAQLDQVRGGMTTPAGLPPTTVGVILWDEVRVPAPPVRHSAADARVTGEMNVFQK